MLSATIIVLILMSFALTSEAIIISGLILKAFCEFSQHLIRTGTDTISISKNLFPIKDPVENYLLEAIVKSVDCASKGSTYNIVDTANTILVVVNVPEWAAADACEPSPGPASDSLRFTDKDICSLIEFPNFLDLFDDEQVKHFLKNFQHQVVTVIRNSRKTPDMKSLADNSTSSD